MTILICVSMSFWVTGCWDGVELQRRAMVLMIGIDPAVSSEPSAEGDSGGLPGTGTSEATLDEGRVNTVKVTLQLARPHRVSDGSTGGSAGGGAAGSPVITVSEQGRDIGEALRKIQLSLDRTLFFGHLQVVVVNRALAEQGMLSILNPMVQSRIVSRNLWVFVSEAPAEQFLQQTPALDVIPAMYLANLFRNRVWVTRPYDATIGGFHQRLATPGIEPYAFMITSVDPKLSAPRIDGIAVFSGDRFAGVLNQSRFTGWAMAENQLPRSRLSFGCPEDPNRQFILDVTSAHSRLRVLNLTGPKPYVDVTVALRGLVEGGACVVGESDRQLRQLKAEVEAQTAAMVKDAVRWSQTRLHADVLGIGREVYRHAPGDWHGDDWWKRVYERLDVRVHVQTRIEFLQTYHRSQLVYPRS
ncbi:MAG: Ger(x)C family spore germination protein [Alicyclobacillus sp.]|nr:Ger(x)C family spore germination protein [Alicyclobacillus sp.]